MTRREARKRMEEKEHDLMRARENTRRQIEEDTCATHGVWCCPKCFDMTTGEEKS